ncbi:MAG: D-glycero-alpha-D-manno-heptose-1,7-bisphosphate 7-phosphatase [Bryobacteraceae bacterium]
MLKNRALFLDRDGVINVDHGYVHRSEDFDFEEGIFELCRAAQDHGYLLIVITNQAGVARGYYSEADFLQLTKWMVQVFSREGIKIAHVYYCPYHPVDGVGSYMYDSPDRKPHPGMLLRARRDFDLDLGASILIGDQLSDIAAAIHAGVGTRILLTRKGTERNILTMQCSLSTSLDDIRRRYFPCATERRPFSEHSQ